nr:chemotaxis protein CheB [Sulfurimonas sp.]
MPLGGPGQIQKIISALPLLKNSTIIIAQHMAVEFLLSFAKTTSRTQQK